MGWKENLKDAGEQLRVLTDVHESSEVDAVMSDWVEPRATRMLAKPHARFSSSQENVHLSHRDACHIQII